MSHSREHWKPDTLDPGREIYGEKSKYTVVSRVDQSDVGDAYYATDEDGVIRVIALAHKGHPACVKIQRTTLLKLARAGIPPTIRGIWDTIRYGEFAERLLIFERLDVNLTQASRFQRLGRAEIKSVAKSVLEALQFIHANDYIYGDLHPATICVNNNPTGGAPRFTAVKLIGFACSIPVGSVMAQKATYKALPLAASPESHLGLHLGTSTDIWSFGNLIISLLHGDDYSIFAPRPSDTEANRAAKLDDPYPILRRMYDCFGHFPERLLNALDTKAKNEIHKIYDMGRPATPFKRVPPTEIPTADRIFIQKIMKLDPAERPTAEELLADEWFDEVSEDTRRSKSRSSSPEWEELPVCPTPRRMCHFL